MALLANIVRVPVKARCSSSTSTRQHSGPKDSVEAIDKCQQIQVCDEGEMWPDSPIAYSTSPLGWMQLGPYTNAGQVIGAAVELASDVDGLQLVLGSAVGDRYRIRVTDDGGVVGLWRR